MGIISLLRRLSTEVRTGLIRKGVSQQPALYSQDPVVRATAFCARLNSKTPKQAIADAILSDCLDGNKIIEAAADVYRDHFRQFRLTASEGEMLASLMLRTPRVRQDLLYGLSVSNLVRHIDIN